MDIIDAEITASFLAGLLDSEVEVDNFNKEPKYIVYYKWRKFTFSNVYMGTDVDIVYSGIIDRNIPINIPSSGIINPVFSISKYFIKCICDTSVSIHPVIKKLSQL